MTPRDELVERISKALDEAAFEPYPVVRGPILVAAEVRAWIREQLPEQARELSDSDGFYRRGQAAMLALVRERLGL